MMYVLVWMQLFSTQTVEHYQLGSYATLEECQIRAKDKRIILDMFETGQYYAVGVEEVRKEKLQ